MKQFSIEAEHCEIEITCDRMSDHFRKAWTVIAAKLPSTFAAKIHFTYVSRGTFNVALGPSDLLFRLLSQASYNLYADKGIFPSILKQAGLAHLAPITCLNTQEAMAHPEVDIWFSKIAHGTGGKGMSCLHRDELADYDLPPRHILQSKIDDIALIDGKKFTSRIYMLIWNRNVFLYNDNFVLIHGVPYDDSSTDYDVQINHEGYNKEGGAPDMQLLSQIEALAKYRPAIVQTAKDLVPALQTLIAASSNSEYIMLGIDILMQNSGDVKIVEVNSVPNFVHTRKMNDALNIPFVTSCLDVMLFGQSETLLRLT